MSENILIFPTTKIERRPGRQETEAFPGQFGTPFALQHGIQPDAHFVQMKHVGGRVFELFGRQLGRTPVRGLLLLRQIHVQQVLA